MAPPHGQHVSQTRSSRVAHGATNSYDQVVWGALQTTTCQRALALDVGRNLPEARVGAQPVDHQRPRRIPRHEEGQSRSKRGRQRHDCCAQDGAIEVSSCQGQQ